MTAVLQQFLSEFNKISKNITLIFLGSALADDGNYIKWSLALNESVFKVNSGGDINLLSGNSSSYNGLGGDVVIAAGSGLSVEGGSGGSISMKAGDGSGEQQYGGDIGIGGTITIMAGNAIEGPGGDVTVQAG